MEHASGTAIHGDPPLATKFRVPRPPGQRVRRPRLIERVREAAERPLTLLAAPAGFGKTTLLAAWLEQAPVRAGWVALEASDDDLIRFWSCVFTALERVLPGSGTRALPLLRTSPLAPVPAIESVLAVWGDTVASLLSEEAAVVVLDDYHVLSAPAIHQSVGYLIDHLPEPLHLVLATRADPPLPLARLRARGQLTELRAAELRFTEDEAKDYLSQAVGPGLALEDIVALGARTEGWIAGLKLAALSLQGHDDVRGFVAAFRGSNRYIIDYLVEEVVARLSGQMQTFLLRTAILERLEGTLCEAVMGWPSGAESGQVMLEQVEQANLFLVPLDDERRWYRYHQLFAEALRHRLAREHGGGVPDLHRRASAWFEAHGLVRDAVHHALTAADFELAARLIESAAEATANRGDLSTLRSWLEAVPDEVIRSRPQLCIWQGWLLAVNGQYDAAEGLLQELESRWRTLDASAPPATGGGSGKRPSTGASGAGQVAYMGRVAAIRAFIAFRCGDDARTIVLARRALADLPENHAFRGLVAWYLGIAYLQSGDQAAGVSSLSEARRVSQAAGSRYVAAMAAYELAQLQARQGHLHQAEQSFQRAVEMGAEHGGYVAATGPVNIGRGDIQREWNQLDAAVASLHEGIAQCQHTGNIAILLFGQVTLARTRQAQGDAEGANAILHTIEQILRSTALAPLNAASASAWHARLALTQGDLALATRWTQERKLRPEDNVSAAREDEYMTLARVLIAQNRPAEALALLGRLHELAERDGRTGNALAILVLQAVASRASGQEVAGLQRLAQALAMAEPEGYIRVFVDEGAAMAALLRHAHARGIAPAYVASLLAHMGAAPPTAPVAVGLLPEPLTDREIEVLRLLVAGLSNAAMAHELVVTVGTVKSHVNHIYGKLGVQSRSQAIARAHLLHLL